MRRDRHSAECSSNGKQALHFPRNSNENIIAKALAIALEHEHANECEGSPVKNASKPKFAQCDLGVLSPALLPMRRDRHTAECSSNGKQALHFPRNPIENIIAKVLAIALEHEHANEREGSPVKGTSRPKFAHACAKSVLHFAINVGGGITNEVQMGTHVKGKLLHARLRTCCVLQCKRRSN